MHSAILDLHIVSGTLGMLSGFVAVFLRKGSYRHGIAGNIFVLFMLSLSLTGVYLALMKLSEPGQPPNLIGGTLTFYMVTTAWLTAKRQAGKPGIVDWGLLLVVLSVAAVEVTWGVDASMSPTRLKYDYPPAPHFFMGWLALLAATGDVRMIVRRGIAGTQRIARHLWRMLLCAVHCVSVDLFGAATSLPCFHAQDGDANAAELSTARVDDLLDDSGARRQGAREE
jgi:uncharacterized membrane protein